MFESIPKLHVAFCDNWSKDALDKKIVYVLWGQEFHNMLSF
jgi:hypothetical protein